MNAVELEPRFEVPLTLFSMWAVYHMIWYFTFRFLFGRVKQFKKRLQDLNIPYESEVEWYSRCVSSEHAIGSLILGTLWHFNILSKTVVMTHTAGYFVFDSFVVLTHLQSFKDEFSTFVHHGIGLFGSWAVLLGPSHMPVWLVKYYLLTEVSTIFVNLRWNFYVFQINKDGKIYLLVGLLMTFSFYLVRTLPLPYIWIRGSMLVWWETYGIGVKIIIFLIVNILCSLNAYWSYKIFLGLQKVFCRPTIVELNP